jgi:hypothetical protein
MIQEMELILKACQASDRARMKKGESIPEFIARLIDASDKAHETLFWIENGPQKGEYTGYPGFDAYINDEF